MSSSAFDDLGFAPPPGAAQTSTPSAPATDGDPAVWTLLGEAGTDPQGQVAVGSTIINRSRRLKATPQDVATDPDQGYEAWQNAADRTRTQKAYPVGSPAYVQAQQTLAKLQSGDIPALPYDSFYSPKGQAALGRKPPSFENGSGVDIGGNRFFSVQGSAPATAWGDLGFDPPGGAKPDPDAGEATAQAAADAQADKLAPPKPGSAAQPPADPTKALLAKQQLEAASASGNAQWPIFDPINHVGRNADGSIAFVGDPATAKVSDNGGLEVNIAASSHPDAIADYLKRHPLDPANHGAAPQTAADDELDPPDAIDKLSAGVQQYLPTTLNTLMGADAAIKSNPIGNAVLSGIEGPNAPNLAQEKAYLGGQTLQRNANDVAFHDSNAYGLGKFGGEVISTLPLMAATDGAAGGLMDATLGGTKFAPAADFLAGQTPGRLIGARGASLAAHGALQGAETAALTSSGSSAPLSDQVRQGAEAGALIAPGMAAGSKFGAGILANAGASKVTPEVAGLADTAINKFGIPLRASQIAGTADRSAAITDSNLISAPGSGYAKNAATQGPAFTRAVSNTIGEDTPSITPQVMQAAKTRIGGVFNRVSANTTLNDADGVLTKLGSVIHDAQQALPEGDVQPLLKQVQNIGSVVEPASVPGGPATISGKSYQALIAKGGPLDRAASSGNPNVRFYAGQIRDVLDDALEASAAPSDLADLKAARLQYKNMKTIEPLVQKAGPDGQISPLLLRGRVNQSFSNSAYTGAGDLGDLAQIGQTFMKEPPNSGTAHRLRDMVFGGGALADIGLAVHDPILAAKIAGAGVAAAGTRYGVNAVRGAMNNNQFYRAALLKAANTSQPVLNKFGALPAVKAVGSFANDNVVPLAVIGAHKFDQRKTQ